MDVSLLSLNACAAQPPSRGYLLFSNVNFLQELGTLKVCNMFCIVTFVVLRVGSCTLDMIHIYVNTLIVYSDMPREYFLESISFSFGRTLLFLSVCICFLTHTHTISNLLLRTRGPTAPGSALTGRPRDEGPANHGCVPVSVRKALIRNTASKIPPALSAHSWFYGVFT